MSLLEPPPQHSPHAAREPSQARGVPRWQDWLGGSLALGALAGLLELGALEVQHLIKGPAALGALQLNPEYPALIPLANLLIFGTVGAAFAIAAPRSKWVGWIGLRLLLALVALAPLLAFRKVHPLAWLVLAVGLSLRLAPALGKLGDRGRRRARWSLLAVVAGAALVIGATLGRGPWREARALAAAPAASPDAPNVLLIVMDTVRADAMGLYGAGRPTTPRLDEFAEQGVVFEQARSASSWTLPSHATMFTGRKPGEHRAGLTRPLDGAYPTLAEHLAGHGYAAGGFVANTIFASRYFGLDRGFHHYEDHVLTARGLLRTSSLGGRIAELAGTDRHMRSSAWTFRKDARRINRDFLAWVDGRDEGRPFFAFLNYYDVHDPYVPPAGDSPRFGLTPETEGEHALLREWHERVKQPDKLTPREVRLARDCYDDCLLDLDARLGELFDGLESRGLLEDTVVVVTSDHGEAFGEKPGVYSHGYWLHRSMLHVPLLIVGPRRVPAGVRVEEPVGLLDLAATIAGLAGAGEGAPFPGRSLARHWSGGTLDGPPDVPFSEEEIRVGPRGHQEVRVRRALVAEGLAYHREPDGREELYELAGDPHELRNLAGSGAHAEALARLRGLMDREVAGVQEAEAEGAAAAEPDGSRKR